ncbi:MAG: hypothetical protein AABY22_07420 [Nanoarchaeota archaeon]
MHKIKKLLLKLENSWIFWSIFIIGVISLFSTLVGSFRSIPSGFLVFPLGFMYVISFGKIDLLESSFMYFFDIIYYGLLGFFVFKIIKDKRFNTKLILILIGILILTMGGCVAMLSNINF